MSKVFDGHSVVPFQEEQAARVTRVGFRDIAMAIRRGGALKQRVVVVHYHKTVCIVFVFVVQLSIYEVQSRFRYSHNTRVQMEVSVQHSAMGPMSRQPIVI